MQKRIFRGALLLTLATALVIGLLSAAAYYHRSGEQLESQLWQELDMLSTLMEQSADQDAEEAALKALNMPNRLTWIAPDGTVRYDNQSNAASMETTLAAKKSRRQAKREPDFPGAFLKPCWKSSSIAPKSWTMATTCAWLLRRAVWRVRCGVWAGHWRQVLRWC